MVMATQIVIDSTGLKIIKDNHHNLLLSEDALLLLYRFGNLLSLREDNQEVKLTKSLLRFPEDCPYPLTLTLQAAEEIV